MRHLEDTVIQEVQMIDYNDVGLSGEEWQYLREWLLDHKDEELPIAAEHLLDQILNDNSELAA